MKTLMLATLILLSSCTTTPKYDKNGNYYWRCTVLCFSDP